MESTQSLQASIHKGTKSIYKERKVLVILMNLGLGTKCFHLQGMRTSQLLFNQGLTGSKGFREGITHGLIACYHKQHKANQDQELLIVDQKVL